MTGYEYHTDEVNAISGARGCPGNTTAGDQGFIISATCDNQMQIFADGVLFAKSQMSTQDMKVVNVTVPANTSCVSIQCKDWVGGQKGFGLIASSDGLETDDTWQCSDSGSGRWRLATLLGPNGVEPWGFMEGISDTAHWIWTEATDVGKEVTCTKMIGK